jgi:hypothetical protein
MRFRSSLTWLVTLLTLSGCARASTGFSVSPDAAAVQSCAMSIALNEGYEFTGRTGVAAPNSGERLVLGVRLSGDSAFPNARIRTATYSGRSSAPVSPAGHRIISRVNRECRFGRTS